MPELGSKISLISKADIRYEGRLFTVDPQECTIALANGKFFFKMDTEFCFPAAPIPGYHFALHPFFPLIQFLLLLISARILSNHHGGKKLFFSQKFPLPCKFTRVQNNSFVTDLRLRNILRVHSP